MPFQSLLGSLGTVAEEPVYCERKYNRDKSKKECTVRVPKLNSLHRLICPIGEPMYQPYALIDALNTDQQRRAINTTRYQLIAVRNTASRLMDSRHMKLENNQI